MVFFSAKAKVKCIENRLNSHYRFVILLSIKPGYSMSFTWILLYCYLLISDMWECVIFQRPIIPTPVFSVFTCLMGILLDLGGFSK